MDVLEFEVPGSAPGALVTRTDHTIFAFGAGGATELKRTFLIKKMEIEFTLCTPVTTDLATLDTCRPSYLVFQKTSGRTDSDTVAEAFDSNFQGDDDKHLTVIWSMPFLFQEGIVDSTSDVVMITDISRKTSKSFPKGYPLDKDEVYTWKIFNASGVNWSTGGSIDLRVRKWGVYI